MVENGFAYIDSDKAIEYQAKLDSVSSCIEVLEKEGFNLVPYKNRINEIEKN